LEEIGAAAFGAEFFAAGFDAEGLLHGSEAQAAGDAVVEDLKVIIFELDDLAAIDADEVVVGWAVEKIWVVGGLAVTEVDFLDECRFDEEAEGAVDGGAGGLQLAARMRSQSSSAVKCSSEAKMRARMASRCGVFRRPFWLMKSSRRWLISSFMGEVCN